MDKRSRPVGRPPLDRQKLLELLGRCPRRGRQLVLLNEREASKKLGWHRATVMRALDELERAGCIRRFRNLGHQGLLIQLLKPPRR